MRDVFDIYTIVFLALAVVIFLKLRSVLGQRTGRERPPYDPYSARDAVRPAAANDKVVALPGRPTEAAPKPVAEVAPTERWKDVAEPGSAIAAGLDAIVGGGHRLRRQAFPHRRARRLRDDRDGLCRGRSAHLEEYAVARGVRGLRGRHPRAAGARRDGRDAASSRSTRPTSSAPSCAGAPLRSRCASSRSWSRSRVTARAP